MVMVTSNSKVSTRMQNNQFGLISEFNPKRSGLVGIPRENKTGVFHRCMNQDLILELNPPHQFVRSAMPNPMKVASPLFGVPRFRSFTGETLQDTREKLIPQDILMPYDPSCVVTAILQWLAGIMKQAFKFKFNWPWRMKLS
jgi:hypothetical protein